MKNRPMPRGPDGAEFRGQVSLALLFWLVGLVVMVTPFLRRPAKADPEGVDPPRAQSEVDIPFEEDVRNFESDHRLELKAAIAKASEAWFGEGSAKLQASGLIQLQRLEPGRVAYGRYCVGCHSSSGDGSGSASRHLEPRPRNFRKGVFKFTSTGPGKPPLPKDIFQTITRGLSGSSMPNFRLLGEERRWDLVEYVRYLAIRGSFEQMALDLAWDEQAIPNLDEAAQIVVKRWTSANLPAVYPEAPEPARSPATIARGKELFLSTAGANCASCHGPDGRGDGPAAKDFKDDWGYPIVPRDLTRGVFRAGSESADLYRSIGTGVKGTPMPSYAGSIPADDIWALVHFVQSLRSGGSAP